MTRRYLIVLCLNLQKHGFNLTTPKHLSESSTKVFYKMLKDRGQICKEE